MSHDVCMLDSIGHNIAFSLLTPLALRPFRAGHYDALMTSQTSQAVTG
jgi:hypothetical protein